MHNSTNPEFIILTLVIGAVIIAIGIFVMAMLRNAADPSKYQKDQYEALENEVEETESDVIGAVVLSKNMTGYWSGSAQTPHYNDCYLVTFQTDDGDKREYSVSKETFDKLYEGQASTLVTVDGEFFAFEDGEEIMDE
ncbi:MAG: DUF2500 family protein [Clostridia bacterium]|nr:DUF2500 family protein [Clostridia bacterium]